MTEPWELASYAGQINKFGSKQLLIIDFEYYGTYESCLFDKMIKTQNLGKTWKGKWLATAYTFKCIWSISTHAREDYSYFIIFTDSHSRFGYVYLMKHMSEAFVKVQKI